MEFKPIAKCGARPPVKEVVQLCEETLANARAGNVRSCLVVMELDDGATTFGVAWPETDIRLIVAELERAKLTCVMKMMAEQDDDGEDLPPTG